MSVRYDVIVVGAGVAGASVAIRLSRQGQSVLLLDRYREAKPTISGELLQPGGVQALERLGLAHCLEGIEAQDIHGFAVIEADGSKTLTYPSQSESLLPLWKSNKTLPASTDTADTSVRGASFHHHRFVQKLRDEVEFAPNIDFIEGSVRSLCWSQKAAQRTVCGVCYQDSSDKQEVEVYAPLTILACGRNNKLLPPKEGQVLSKRVAHSVGVLLRDATLPHPGFGHVIFATPAPILAYQIDEDVIRVLVDYPKELPPRRDGVLARDLVERVAPQLPEGLRTSFLGAVKQGKLQVIQNFQRTPERPSHPGIVLMGDALSMRHPLTGGGMTVALNDAWVLTEQLATVDLRDLATCQQSVRRFYRQREPMAATIDILAAALYEIFKAEMPGHSLMRDAVMRYWSLGGMAVNGPMALLAGVSPSPLRLAAHYCAVALLGVLQQSSLRNSSRLFVAAAQTLFSQVDRGLRLFQR